MKPNIIHGIGINIIYTTTFYVYTFVQFLSADLRVTRKKSDGVVWRCQNNDILCAVDPYFYISTHPIFSLPAKYYELNSTVRCYYNPSQFSQKYSQKTSHSSPVRARYEVSFVNPASDWYSAWVPAIIYAISYYIWLRCNSIWLYISRLTYIWSHKMKFTLSPRTTPIPTPICLYTGFVYSHLLQSAHICISIWPNASGSKSITERYPNIVYQS